ncbi:DUF3549 family protein [Vreelandella aquamarina]
MQPITTLNEFFERSGAEVSLFHMGRRVTACAQETLAALEKQQAPWPEPWKGQARLGILFRLGNMPEPAIWFLAFPLDEQGYLVAGQRDAFLQRLLETLGRNARNVDTDNSDDIEHLMQDNPLSFTPSTHFQAMFNAQATQCLNLPASQHFEPVEAYVSQQITIDWQALGLQGIADFVVRMDAEQSAQLTAMLPDMPVEMLHAVAYCLEHVALSHALAEALTARGEQAAQRGDLETLCACIRAVGSTSEERVGQWYQQLLSDTAACGPDTLAAIAGRGWRHLEHGERLPLFLNRLAEDPRTDFTAVIRDLALIPRLRLPIIMSLKDAQDGAPLQQRLAALTTSTAKADD